MLYLITLVVSLWALPSFAAEISFRNQLYAKFQVKACTTCHDFFEKKRGGLSFNSHKGRTADMCVDCHTKEVTGFKHDDEWFARPGLYLGGMGARQTCQSIKAAIHAKFKNPTLVAREIEKHLLEDPRILWAIEGALPSSGMLPEDKMEKDLVKGGLAQWQEQVRDWIVGGLKCD